MQNTIFCLYKGALNSMGLGSAFREGNVLVGNDLILFE
jgi:hypothetical protein